MRFDSPNSVSQQPPREIVTGVKEAEGAQWSPAHLERTCPAHLPFFARGNPPVCGSIE